MIKIISINQAFDTLANTGIKRKTARKSFQSIVGEVKKDPELQLEKLGQIVKSMSESNLSNVSSNIKRLSFSKLRLYIAGFAIQRSAKKAFSTREALMASGKKLQKEYPELIEFLTGLFTK